MYVQSTDYHFYIAYACFCFSLRHYACNSGALVGGGIDVADIDGTGSQFTPVKRQVWVEVILTSGS